MATKDTQALFLEYLRVVNQAIEEHRTEFPYKQIIAASQPGNARWVGHRDRRVQGGS